MQKDDIFDLQVRSLLEDAEAEVPEGVWAAVSAGLEPKRKAAPFWRYAAATFAAAAAAAGIWIGVRIAQENALPSAPVFIAGNAEAVAGESAAEESVALIEDAVPGENAPLMAQASTAPRRNVSRIPEISEASGEKAGEEALVETAAPEKVTPETMTPETMTPEKVTPAARDEEEAVIPVEEDLFAGLDDESVPSRAKAARWSLGIGSDASYGGDPEPFIPPRRAPGMRPAAGVTEAPGKSDYSLPLSFGLNLRYKICNGISIGTGVQYTLLSRRFDGTYYGESGPELAKTVSGRFTQTLSYVGVPLNLYFNLASGSKITSYAFIGGTFEKGLTNRYRIPDGENDIIWKNKIEGVQLSAAAGLGLQYMILPKFSIYAEPDIRYFFDCKQPRSIRTQQPLQLSLSLGLRYDFR